MKKLQEVLIERLVTQQAKPEENDNHVYLDMLLTAKRIEGCSERTIEYYRSTIKTMLDKIETPVRQMTTEILRDYLPQYQGVNKRLNNTIFLMYLVTNDQGSLNFKYWTGDWICQKR